MSENLISSQVLGFRPNSYTAFATTNIYQHESTLFAYAAEHAIVIYDRIMYHHKIILTPDPTSRIVALTFFGHDALYCCNSKGILFHYSRTNYKDGPLDSKDIGCCPSSMTASNRSLFIISGPNIYILPVNKPLNKTNLILLTDTQSHLEVSVSPCGRAMASYARNGPSPVLWFEPYEKGMRSVLPLKVNVIDFQWACTQYLTAVTCDQNNAVRIWTETKNTAEMRCIAYYTFQNPVRSISIMLPNDKWHNPRGYVPRQNKQVFPLVLQPPLLVMASLANEIVILEQTSRPLMRRVGSIPVEDNNTIITLGDLSYIYSERQIKRQIHALRFSHMNLTFIHIELGETTVLWSIPLIRHFIHAPVKRLFLMNDHYVSEYTNGTFFDWSEEKMIEKVQDEIIIRDNLVINTEKSAELELDFHPSSFSKYKDNEQTIVIAFNDKNICGCIFGVKNMIISATQIDEKIEYVSMHSSDLFAVSTSKNVYIYFYHHKMYEIIAKRDFVNPRCFFLPHSLILLAIQHGEILDFYVVNRNKILSASEIGQNVTPLRTTPVYSLSVMPNDAIFVSTYHALFKVNIHESNIPQPVKTGSKVFLTCFTLGFFNAMNKLSSGIIPGVPDFLNRGDSDIIQQVYNNSKDNANVPKEFAKVYERLPNNWMNLDRYGMNCLLGNILAEETDARYSYALFGIWGLLSRNQNLLCNLIPFKSVDQLLKSMICLWTVDNELLKSVVCKFVSHLKPSHNEFDDFILLCTCVNKNILSQKICGIYDQEKLANTIDLFSTGRLKSKSCESGAYRALREHRPMLASVFFIFNGDKDSAVKCLRENNMMMILVARLLDYRWRETIIEEFTDVYGGFYSRWWADDRDGAINILKELEIPSAKVVSSEFHRYQILLELGVEERKLILSLQPYSVFAATALTQTSSGFQQSNVEQNNIQEQKNNNVEDNKNDEKSEEESMSDDDMKFDFGGRGGWDDDDISDEYDSDSDESEEEKSPKDHFAEVIKVPPPKKFEKDELDIVSRLINTFNRSPYVIPQRVPLGTNQHYIAGLIARLFSGRQPEQTAMLLEEIAEKLYDNEETKYLAYVVIFALMEAKHLPNMIDMLFDGMFDKQTFKVFMMQVRSRQTFAYPDLLSAFVSISAPEVTHNDRRIVCLLAIHRLMEIVKPHLKAPLPPLFSFLHTRHRRYFTTLKNFNLSKPNFAVGLDPIDPEVTKHIESMNSTKMAQNYRISISDDFMSPFYSDGEFQFTRTFATRSRAGRHVRGIAINATNNMNVAVVAKQVVEFHITQEDLNATFDNRAVMKNEDEWVVVDVENEDNKDFQSDFNDNYDSHFTSLLESCPTVPDPPVRGTRSFNMHWNSHEALGSDVEALCIASHPTKPTYITGSSNGRLHCWDFGKKTSRSSLHCSDSPITHVCFNRCGDKILATSKTGNIIISDFTSAFQPLLRPFPLSSVCWLNNDTQFIVTGSNGIGVVDTTIGNIVCSIECEMNHPRVRPCSVWGPYISVGCGDGTVNVFDVRMCKILSSFKEHSGVVTSVDFDMSGSFLITASSDNTVCVVDGLDFNKREKIIDVLGSSNSTQPHSIQCVGISNQVIVAGGYSPLMRAWTISEPKVI